MLLLLFFSFLLTVTSGAKILCIFSGMSRSHYTLGFTLMKEMADRGHDVTYISPFKEEKPIKNFKSIALTGLLEKAEEMRNEVNIFELFHIPVPAMILMMGHFGVEGCDTTLGDEAVQNVLHGNETYDVLISEHFLSEPLQGIAHHLNIPSISIAPIGPNIWTNHIMGAPDIYSHMPHFFLGYSQGMTFWERIHNFLVSLLQQLFDHLYYLPQQNKILHKYLPDAPNIYDLLHNTSLFLFNSDPIFGHSTLLAPNMIEIGGFHVRQPKKLPEDLQRFMDEAKEGVIYFSMGSNLKSKDMPKQTREAILRVFSKLKQKVLWKFEDNLEDKPDNVEIRSWLPQQDILAHPNVKLFITHGGLLSTTESLYRGVPFMGIPVYGDQELNMKYAVNHGYGIALPFHAFEEKKFAEAIKEILNNPIYTENARRISVLLKDKQVTQLEKAIYWVEYVIRHKGVPHLRSAAVDLNWYQYHSFDVILFLILVVIMSFKLLRFTIKKILNNRKKNKEKTN